jgi:hypothetical protein
MKALWDRIMLWLRVDVPSDGLEITDHAIRWCRIAGGVPQTFVVKVPPGVMQDGKILDRPALVALLTQVHDAASGPRPGAKKILVVLTLGSAPTFMQLFYLPLIERNRLEKAIILNLQMISPSEGATTNAGWQVLSEDAEKNRFEVVGVFIGRILMDDMMAALLEAGFVVVAAESKALSLSRALAKGGGGLDPRGAYIMVSCDDTDMDFMIVRKGLLCFAYTIPWLAITDEQGQVPEDRFAAALTRGVRQIVNFYEQHWPDPVTAVVIVANNLLPTVQAIIAADVSYAIVPFVVGANDAFREIPVVFGAALRGISPREEDHDVTLLESGASEIYAKEKTVFFLKFWRTVLPVTLGIIVAAALLGDTIWFGTSERVATAAVPVVPAGIASQLAALTLSARDFNQMVGMMTTIETPGEPKSAVVARFEAVASSSGITIMRLALGARGTPVTLTGTAPSEEAIVAFKNALVSSTLATNVELPLSGIQPSTAGFSFAMTVNQ